MAKKTLDFSTSLRNAVEPVLCAIRPQTVPQIRTTITFVWVQIEPPYFMADSHYYLKQPNSKEPTLINFFFQYAGRRMKVSTGIKILPSHWNSKSEFLKSAVKDSAEYNEFLRNFKKQVETLFVKMNAEGTIPTPDELRERLHRERGRFVEDGTEMKRDFFAMYEDMIKLSTGVKSSATKKVYETNKRHLKDFEKETGFKVSFARMDREFYDRFVQYLTNHVKLNSNSIGKSIATLKTFLNHAERYGCVINPEFRYFKVNREESDSIYLS